MSTLTKIGLVTDSPCDLPLDLVEKFRIEVVPAILVLDGQSYIDGETISREEFYRRLPALRIAPSTAAPSPLAFSARYEKFLSAGCEHVICISTAASLTSLHNVARAAAADFPGRVTVLDSGQLTLGIGFQVLAAAEALAAGADLAEALAIIQSTRQRIRLMGVLDTLEYVRRSGRVGWAAALAGDFFRIKQIISLHLGVVGAAVRVRTSGRALEALAQCPRVTLCLVVDLPASAGADARMPVLDYDEVVSQFPTTPIDDEALGPPLLYSSGTTGRPKGIIRPLPGCARLRQPKGRRWCRYAVA